MLDSAVTGNDGSYVFEALPRSASGVVISVPGLRACRGGPGVYLRAKPVTLVKDARDEGTVFLEKLSHDVPDIDFRFAYWGHEHGYLDASPAPGPRATEE